MYNYVSKTFSGRNKDSAIFYGKDSSIELKDRINRYISEFDPSNVLFLGDSTLIRHSNIDNSVKGIDGFLQELCGEKIVTIAGTAYNFELFYGILKVLAQNNRLPNVCILPINIRSFSPLWMFNPSFSQVKAFERLVNEKSLFTLYDEEEFFQLNVNITDLGERKAVEYRLIAESSPALESLRRLRSDLLFRFHYMFDFPVANPLLIRLKQSIDLLLKEKVKIILYFTPLNSEAGCELIGSCFGGAINECINKIRQCIIPQSDFLDISDWSSICGKDCFFSPYIANEHLNEKGRRQVALLLQERLWS